MSNPTWGTGNWGQNQWGDQSDVAFTLTGFALTNTLGDETTAGEINTGWGRLTWGENAWGEYGDAVITGIGMTANLGSVTTQADANATNSTNNNQELGVTVGTVIATGTTVAYINDTDLVMTATQGTADAGPDAMATGNHATMGLGSVSAYNEAGWGRQHWGDNAWGVEGTWVTALVSGIGMTATLGSPSEISGDATITANTLSVAQVTLGTVDVAPDAMVSGEFMIAALGTLGHTGDANVSLTGIAMTAALASVTADAITLPTITGFAMTMALGDETIKIHTDVALTGIALTCSLGAGSALIWNEVNTGSAPLDPPGWVEVAA
tara:strand:- start:3 stop:974 length:972 start_codon:yes stop_codon:yes gene_type:complete